MKAASYTLSVWSSGIRNLVACRVSCCAVVMLCFLGQMAKAQDESSVDSELQALMESYEDERAKAAEPIAELYSLYQSKLEELAKKQQTAGDLESYLKTNEELKGFRESEGLVEGASPELAELRKIYDSAMSERLAQQSGALSSIRRAYVEKLDALVASLTKSGKIEDALKVRNFKSQLEEGGGAVMVSNNSPGELSSPPRSGAGTLHVWGFQLGDKREMIPVTEPNPSEAKGVRKVGFDGFRGRWHAIEDDGELLLAGWPEDTEKPRGKIRNIVDLAGGSGGGAVTADGEVIYFAPPGVLDAIEIPDLEDVAALEIGNGWTLALKKDGTAVFGGARSSQGDRFENPKPEELQNVRLIASGLGVAFVQRNDGSAHVWTFTAPGQAVSLPEGAVVKDARFSELQGLILLEDGTVVPYGNVHYPVPDDLGKVQAIRATHRLYAAQKEDGTWVAWGEEFHGVIEKINEIGKAKDLEVLVMRTSGVVALAWIE